MKRFLSEEECALVSGAVAEAEHSTSGEIRIHIDSRCPGEPKERALRTFHALKMERTAARNAVLIYVSPSDRKLAVLGDKGINDVVPDGFWKDVCGLLSSRFASGQFVGGLCEAVSLIGSKLKAYFPYADNDVNELPDEVTFGDIAGDDAGESGL